MTQLHDLEPQLLDLKIHLLISWMVFLILFVVSTLEEIQVRPHRIRLSLLIHISDSLTVSLRIHLEQCRVHIILLEVALIRLELVLKLLVLLLQEILLTLKPLNLGYHGLELILLLQLFLLDSLRLSLSVNKLLLKTNYPLKCTLAILIPTVYEGLAGYLDNGTFNLALFTLHVFQSILERPLLRGLDVQTHVLLGKLLILELRVVDLLEDFGHVGLRVIEDALFFHKVEVQVLILHGDVTKFSFTLTDLTDHIICGDWLATMKV